MISARHGLLLLLGATWCCALWVVSGEVSRQESMLGWEGELCVVERAETVGKRKRFRFMERYTADVRCVTRNTYKKPVTNMWYYGSTSGDRSGINLVTSLFPIGSTQTAYCDPLSPSDPSQCVLLKDVWFRPYGFHLVTTFLILTLMWYIIVEHKNSAQKKPDCAATWHCLTTPPHDHRAMSFYYIPALIVITWHATGVWVSYIYSTHGGWGHNGATWMYHLVGLVLAARLGYLWLISCFIGELTILLDTRTPLVDTPCRVRLVQPVDSASGVTYTHVILSLYLSRATSTSSLPTPIYQKDYALLAHSQVSPPGLDIDFPSLCFPKHASGEGYQWVATVDIAVRGLPFKYTKVVPVVVGKKRKQK